MTKSDDSLAHVHADIERCLDCRNLAPGLRKPIKMDRGDVGQVLIVGQAPGNAEHTRERAFAGAAGTTLNQWLVASGADPIAPRRGVYMTSVLKCLCPTKSLFPHMADRCRGFLSRQIGLIRPALVITLGRPAFQELRVVDTLDYDDALCIVYSTAEHVLVTNANHHYKLVHWPHPSGLNRWHNSASNRARLETSFGVLHEYFKQG